MSSLFDNPALRCPPAELRARLKYDDARLLGECRVDLHRVSGPGGQHRNKVSSAVRLTHQPSGLVSAASERRSQHENRAMALDRLRETIALAARAPLPESIEWPERARPTQGRLRVGERNPALQHVIALVLDALAEAGADLKPAAARLGLTPSSLAKFLYDHPKAWREAGRMRAAMELPPLRNPR